MKQLIVNADDFGRAPGVNRGILAAHHTGIVTSTTVMVNYPDAPAAIEQALSTAPDLGLGLHLNLTSGSPVSPADTIPSLLNGNGEFYHVREWATRFDSLDPDAIRREMTAQVERFVSLARQPPDHLDSHHHATYLHPVALETMFDIANRYNIPMRHARLDTTYEAARSELIAIMPGVPETFARSLYDQLHAVISQQPRPPFWPARMENGYFAQRATLGDLLLILTNLADGSLTELMCHPGYVDDALAGSSYLNTREEELGHLTHAATRECIQSEGITLIAFGDLTR
jgi:predicted glycoside hydrolase/deacetylase ChbG (UPF0249 family)